MHQRARDHVDLAETGPTDYMGSRGLRVNMKQKLWTLVFVLASMKTGLDFFHGRTDRDGTLGTQEGHPSISTPINHLATPQSPAHGPVEFLPCNPLEEPNFHHQHTEVTDDKPS